MNTYMKDLRPEYNIIDIRDSYSYNLGHVSGAKNISMDDLLNFPGKYLNKTDKYYIYCKSGVRSTKTCELLRLLGYNVINVVDGFGR